MSQDRTHYNLSAQLVQGVVNVLNQLPAGQVRGLLNQLETECTAQDAQQQPEPVKPAKAKATKAAKPAETPAP